MTTGSISSPPLAERSDEELARRARAGSLSAYGELVKRFETRVFTLHRRRGWSASDAEDLTQEAFVRTWQSLDRWRPTERFSPWLFTIALRTGMKEARSRARRAARERIAAETRTRRDADRPGPIDRVGDPDGRDLWALADEVLSEAARTALWLVYAEDLSPAEAARVLGKSAVSVRVMLHRARKTLANRLTAEGLDDGQAGRNDSLAEVDR